MKVTGPNSASAVSSSKRRSGAGGEGFSVETPSGGSAGVAATSGASALTSVDAILALQSVGDFTEAKRQATERAFTLLDVLDDLKLSLLEGGIPRARPVATLSLEAQERHERSERVHRDD